MGKIKFQNIDTDRLILRKFKITDAESFLYYRTNPKVALYQSSDWLNYTMDKALEFATRQGNNEPGIPGDWFQIAVELKSNGKLIGDCAIHTLQNDPRQVEIGYTISPEYQNMGYAMEAVKALLDYLFKDLNMHRVIAVADVRNSSSVKLMEKLGMRREAHFLKNELDNGEYIDEYSYALLNEEWK